MTTNKIIGGFVSEKGGMAIIGQQIENSKRYG
jgi:hypothetical protein